MEKVSLYIAGEKVDLDDNTFILFNYIIEDLSNPTIVKNSFSKQITLKGTPTNNKIFGNLYRIDRKTIFGEKYTGVDFNPLRRTPFAVYNEMNEIQESGYLKLDKVVTNGATIEYSVTLYGGLGSFFYGLMYDNDGNKKTLGDLRYLALDGNYITNPGNLGPFGGWQMLQMAWNYLSDPEGYTITNKNNWCSIVNFAPCYNGHPTDFSADKAVVVQGTFKNLPTLSPKSGVSSNLMLMANAHSEWEIKDLRWYLQRPVFRVKALFDAICDKENNGGFNVILDPAFFNESNDLYWNGWITLPLIPTEERQASNSIVKLLSSTLSPAEYLISFAKIFGLIFHMKKDYTLVIVPKKGFFLNETIDLSARISSESITIKPLLAAHRYYQFGGNAIGEWAAQYKEDFGRDYAIQKVNTGNEFDKEISIVTDGIQYKDAVDVQERSRLFVVEVDYSSSGQSGLEIFRLPNYEKVSIQNWSGEEMSEVDMSYDGTGNQFNFNTYYALSDWLPKTQFHDADNKEIDSANVLLVFNGVMDAPQWRDWAGLQYRISDDTSDMLLLNDGLPCWNLSSQKSVKISALPSFRRSKTELIPDSGDEIIHSTFEWGEPFARGVNGSEMAEGKVTIYDRFWKEYQSDRFDVDTFILQCKVNLNGLQVGQDLMRRFFYYQGSIFVLNKISNHSITTEDLTECEFIKVKDIKNYTQGQTI